MRVFELAETLGLWSQICAGVTDVLLEKDAKKLLLRIAELPVKSSRAVRSLGVYVSKGGEPICIRLQFAQEPDNLKETFLHELAHFCDHLCHQTGLRYRRAHGPLWQAWAKALGTPTERCGKSEALQQLHHGRLKLVAVCQKCGVRISSPQTFKS